MISAKAGAPKMAGKRSASPNRSLVSAGTSASSTEPVVSNSVKVGTFRTTTFRFCPVTVSVVRAATFSASKRLHCSNVLAVNNRL